MIRKRNQTVLIISSHYPPNLGGVESHLQALVSALDKNKWRVIISTYQPLAAKIKAPSLEKKRNLTIYRCPWLGFNIVHKLTHYPALEFLYLFPGLFLLAFYLLCKSNKQIDVLHAQGLVPTAVGGVLAFIFNKRMISSIHNMYFFPKKGLYKLVAGQVFNMAKIVLAPTRVAADELISVGVIPDKVKLFKYWLNLETFKPQRKSKAKKKIGFNNFTVLFVGRLLETKGIKIIIKMLDTLNKNINLVIAGDGPLRDYVEKAVKENSNLRYLGRIENNRLPQYYSGADLLVVPSTVDEGWGFVAMEAISCGTPVVASKKGGLSDVVSPEVGTLVTLNQSKFKQAIEELYSSPVRLKKLKTNCRRYALKYFGDNNIQDIIKHYDSQ